MKWRELLLTVLFVMVIFAGCNKENSQKQDIMQMLSANASNQYGTIINGLALVAKNPFPEAIPKIIELTGSDNQKVRSAAIAALKKYGPIIIPDLVKYINVPNDNMKNACLELLEYIGKPALPTMKTLLKTGDDIVKMSVINVLGKIGDKSVIVDLVNLLNSKKPEIVIAAAVALGNLHAKAAEGAIVKLLSNPNYNIKTAAVQALRKIGDPNVADLIIANIKKTDDTDYLLNALLTVEALTKKYKLQWATGVLNDIFSYEKTDSRVMAEAAYISYEAGFTTPIINIEQWILGGTYYNYPVIMAYFVDVFHRIGKQRHIVNTYKQILKHYDQDLVRAKIYDAMYDFGYKQYEQKMIDLAKKTKDGQAFQELAQAAKKYNFKEICKILPEAVNKPIFDIITSSIELASYFKCPEMISYFKNVFSSGDKYSYDIKQAILDNIKNYDKKSALEVLKIAKNDKDPYIQFAAGNLIEELSK